MKVMEKPKTCIMRAAGTNCDYETSVGLQLAGATVEIIHVNEFIRGEKKVFDYRLIVVPGGFSYGDYVASGKIFANKLKYGLRKQLIEFIEQGNLLMGICNGFQVLVKAGILPGFNRNYDNQLATLSFNDSGHLQCEWVNLINVNKGKCIYTRNIKSMYVPI